MFYILMIPKKENNFFYKLFIIGYLNNHKKSFFKYYQESINNSNHILLILILEMGNHNDIDISSYVFLHNLKILVVEINKMNQSITQDFLFFIYVATQFNGRPFRASCRCIQIKKIDLNQLYLHNVLCILKEITHLMFHLLVSYYKQIFHYIQPLFLL